MTRSGPDHGFFREARWAPPRRTVLTAAATLALTLTTLYAGPSAAVEPDGPANPVLDVAHLDAELERVVDEGGGVGAVAEARAGAQVWRGAAGLARVDPDRRAKPRSQFRAASVTKTPTAVLALQLVAEGQWTLETTIDDVLPGLWPGRGDVTLRQLLSHTSGMPEYLVPLLVGVTSTEDFVAVVSKRRTEAELVRAAQTLPWTFEPGTSWSYSNTNFVVVGMMLHAATGERVAELVRTRIVKPARMTQSRLATSPLVVEPWLREYTFLAGEQVDLGSFHPTLFGAAGALLTTTRDLTRFHQALSQGRLLNRQWVRELRTPVFSDPTTGIEYGLGSYRLPDPCELGGFVHGHDGASFGTMTWSFSSEDGQRQATVAATGRSLDDPTRPLLAVAEMTGTALLATCAPSAPSLRHTAPQVPRSAAPQVPVTHDPLTLVTAAW